MQAHELSAKYGRECERTRAALALAAVWLAVAPRETKRPKRPPPLDGAAFATVFLAAGFLATGFLATGFLATFFVDFHVVDPLAPSHLRIQKAGGPASQSSLQRCVREAIKVKADSYQREAEHREALLLPFVVTAVGGFTPSRPHPRWRWPS